MKILENTYLCLKYPFLYPRNRWDDKHHNNFHWIYRIWKFCDNKSHLPIIFGYKFHKDPESSDIIRNRVIYDPDNQLYFVLDCGIIRIYDKNKFVDYFDVQQHVGDKFQVTGIEMSTTIGCKPIVYYHVIPFEKTETSYGFSYHTKTITTNKFFHLLCKIVKWTEHHIIDPICFLPTSNELNAMDSGWKKAFGLQMCEEIKQALLKEGGLKKLLRYRIVQIKEKWGQLRWYDCNGCKSVNQIIDKYTEISEKTCGCCGKPAKYRTRGWVYPYCEECIKKHYGDNSYENDENIEKIQSS